MAGGLATSLLRRRVASAGDATPLRLGAPRSAVSEELPWQALRLAVVISALLLVILAALPLFAEIGKPTCLFGNGASCGDGPPIEPWSALLLIAPLVPLILSIHRDLRVP